MVVSTPASVPVPTRVTIRPVRPQPHPPLLEVHGGPVDQLDVRLHRLVAHRQQPHPGPPPSAAPKPDES